MNSSNHVVNNDLEAAIQRRSQDVLTYQRMADESQDAIKRKSPPTRRPAGEQRLAIRTRDPLGDKWR